MVELMGRVQTNLKAETCDGLSKLLIGLAQDADEMHHSTSIHQRHFVVRVLIDEVPRGTGGIALHCLVVTGKQLNQSWNAMQDTNLKREDQEEHTSYPVNTYTITGSAGDE